MRTIWLALAAWLAVSLVTIGVLAVSEVGRLRTEFQRESESIYEIVRQRLDQNEAVLAGIEALLSTFPGLKPLATRSYAKEMLDRYQHIYTIELQPRVEFGAVRGFERWARTHIDRDYRIKDFGFSGERNWRPASPRPFYYPITFMEPAIEGAKSVLGLDVYADRKFHAAIDETIRTGRPAVSAPFDLFEGGRGYLIFKAIFSSRSPSSDLPARYAEATRVVSMLIHTNKFLSRDELPSKWFSMRLYHRGYDRNSEDGSIDRIDPEPRSRLIRSVFPEFVFERSLPSESQPFEFETRRQVGLEVIRPLPTVLTLVASLAITALSLVILRQRKVAKSKALEVEQRMFRERERAMVILQSIADAVLTVDRNGVVEYANPVCEVLLAKSQNAIVGSSIDDVLPIGYDLARQMQSSPFLECLLQQTAVQLPDHSYLVRENAERVLVEGSASPLFDQEQVLSGAVIVLRDMGPVRTRALEALQASEQRLRDHQSELAHVGRLHSMGEMASGIAHELNQPLTAILSYNQACLRLLREAEVDYDMVEHAMRSTTEQAKRAGEIIKRLRAFVSKRPVSRQPLDMRQVVQNVLTLTESELRTHAIVPEVVAPSELPYVDGDSVQVEQLVLNLVRNALEAMENQPDGERRLTLVIESDASMVYLSVKDNGSGISSLVREKLFHPFQTTKANGMGLGLTICQSIAEMHGGKLIESSEVEQGAEFILFLPAMRTEKSGDAGR